MSDANSAGKQQVDADHSGFVEHLRLVHFTLCLTCFIAIIAVATKSPSSAQRAYDQGNQLLKLQSKWEGGKWLDDLAQAKGIQTPAFDGRVEAAGIQSRSLVFRPGAASGRRQWERYRWLAFARQDKAGLSALKPETGKSFATIEDAEAIWNMLDEFRYVVTPSLVHDGWVVKPSPADAKLNGGTPVAVAPRVAAQTTDDVAFTRWFLPSDVEDYMASEGAAFRDAALELMKAHKADSYFIAILRDRNNPNGPEGLGAFQAFLMFPADCKVEKIDLQQLLGTSTLPAETPFGDFKHSFHDASDLGKNLKTLKLAELRDYFQAEQDRTADKVELPLVKLPAESVAYWGAAVIFLLATYWFAVFRDFGSRAKPIDKAWDVPWIGTSNERWSQGLFLATTLLPPCTAGYLVFHGLDRSFDWKPLLLLAVTAIVLVGVPIIGVILSWHHLQRLDVGTQAPTAAGQSDDGHV